MRELARTGLSPADQKKFSASLSNAVETRARYFPADPLANVDRVRRFLMHTFFPQMGPLQLLVDPMHPPERISRNQCWQIAHLELSLLDGPSRPADELRTVISEVVAIMARNEFPSTVPPRWLVELFSVLERVVALKMETLRWTLRPSVPLGAASQAFLEAILKNMDNDRRRSQRQHVSPWAEDTEALMGSSGQSLLPPEDDPLIPPIPTTFPWGHLSCGMKFPVWIRPSVSGPMTRPRRALIFRVVLTSAGPPGRVPLIRSWALRRIIRVRLSPRRRPRQVRLTMPRRL